MINQANSDILQQILEYFIILGVHPSIEQANSSIYQTSNQIKIKDYYPKDNKPKEFINSLYLWCFANGIQSYDEEGRPFLFNRYSKWEFQQKDNSGWFPISHKMKSILEEVKFTHFVITDENSQKHYCTSMQIYELRKINVNQYEAINNSAFVEVKRVLMPKVFVFTSTENKMKIHKQILSFVYFQILANQYLQSNENNMLKSHAISFNKDLIRNFEKFSNNYGYRETQKQFNRTEKLCYENQQIVKNEFVIHFILSLICETLPRIRFQQSQIAFSMAGKEIFRQFISNKSSFFEIDNISYRQVTQKVSIESIVDIFEAVILEKQIIIFAQNPSEIVHLCEAILTFIRPLVWNCIYVPFLPTEMLETLHTMVPYIVGVHRSNKNQVLKQIDSENKLFYDLDSDYVIKDGQQIPTHFKSWLIKELQENVKNIRSKTENYHEELENRVILNIKKTFLLFMVSLINNYLQFITNPMNSSNYQNQSDKNIFDFKAYQRFIDPEISHSGFFQEFIIKTMMFRQFIEESNTILCSFFRLKKDWNDIDYEMLELPPCLKHLYNFMNEIIRIKQSINNTLSFPQSNNIISINLIYRNDLLSLISAEYENLINNYLNNIASKQTKEMKTELLKYLTFISKDSNTQLLPFLEDYQQQTIFEQIQNKIPILNLDDILNQVDHKINNFVNKSTHQNFNKNITSKQPFVKFEEEFETSQQNCIPTPFETQQSSALKVPNQMFTSQEFIQKNSENQFTNKINYFRYQTIDTISPIPVQDSQQILSERSIINKNPCNQIATDSDRNYYSKTSLGFTVNREQRVARETEDRLISTQRNISRNILVSSSLIMNNNRSQFKSTSPDKQPKKRRIFENSQHYGSQQFQESQIKNDSGIYNERKQTLTSNSNFHHNYFRGHQRCSKTEVSLDRLTNKYKQNQQIMEDFRGENELKEENFNQNLNQISQIPISKTDQKSKIEKKSVISSPNRSYIIPEENQGSKIIPEFFQGQLEMKNIVTLNIDQITSSCSMNLLRNTNQETVFLSTLNSQNPTKSSSACSKQKKQSYSTFANNQYPWSQIILQTEEANENSKSQSFNQQQRITFEREKAQSFQKGELEERDLKNKIRSEQYKNIFPNKSAQESTFQKKINKIGFVETGYSSNFHVNKQITSKSLGTTDQRKNVPLYNKQVIKNDEDLTDTEIGEHKPNDLFADYSQPKIIRVPFSSDNLKELFSYNSKGQFQEIKSSSIEKNEFNKPLDNQFRNFNQCKNEQPRNKIEAKNELNNHQQGFLMENLIEKDRKDTQTLHFQKQSIHGTQQKKLNVKIFDNKPDKKISNEVNFPFGIQLCSSPTDSFPFTSPILVLPQNLINLTNKQSEDKQYQYPKSKPNDSRPQHFSQIQDNPHKQNKQFKVEIFKGKSEYNTKYSGLKIQPHNQNFNKISNNKENTSIKINKS